MYYTRHGQDRAVRNGRIRGGCKLAGGLDCCLNGGQAFLARYIPGDYDGRILKRPSPRPIHVSKLILPSSGCDQSGKTAKFKTVWCPIPMRSLSDVNATRIIYRIGQCRRKWEEVRNTLQRLEHFQGCARIIRKRIMATYLRQTEST